MAGWTEWRCFLGELKGHAGIPLILASDEEHGRGIQLSLYAGRTIEDMKLHSGASRLMPRSFRWGWARRPLDPASNQLLEHSRQFLGCCYKYNLYYVLALQETPLQMLVIFSGHILLIF